MGIQNLFSERQVIVRTADGVRYIKLSPLRQKLYAGCALLAFAGVLAVPVSNLARMHLADFRFDEIPSLQSVYRSIIGGESDSYAVAFGEEATERPHEAFVVTPEERIAALERRLRDSESERKRIVQERDRIDAERQRLASGVTAVEKRANALAAQQEAVQELIKRAKAALERSSKSMSKLGVDPSRMLAAAPRNTGGAAGGPFVDARRIARGHPAQADIVELANNLNRLSSLQQAARALPLGKPLPNYQLSSSFGLRKDPFNGNLAVHNGLDMVAPTGTEIRVRAAGRVVHAGRNGVYGNMVEVDHGYGIRTRYGHLSQITVRKGQTVAPRDKLGLVGSTGRSTAPHLHYEVLFNGKTMDPRKFVEARANVFQN